MTSHLVKKICATTSATKFRQSIRVPLRFVHSERWQRRKFNIVCEVKQLCGLDYLFNVDCLRRRVRYITARCERTFTLQANQFPKTLQIFCNNTSTITQFFSHVYISTLEQTRTTYQHFHSHFILLTSMIFSCRTSLSNSMPYHV